MTPDPEEPAWLAALRAFATEGARAVRRVGENVRADVVRFQQSEAAETVRRGARWLREDAAPVAARVITVLLETYQWLMPANWRGLTVLEAMSVSELMWKEGWGLAWVPSQSVLRQLIALPDIESRKVALLSMEGEVLEDLDHVLGTVTRPELATLVWAGREAVETYRSGYWMGAQALAGATLSTIIHHHYGLQFWEAKEQFERTLDPEEEEALDWRQKAVTGAIRRALDRYKPVGGGDAPHFNRHATAHHVAAPQYSQANSLAAAMLLVCAIRERQWVAEWEQLRVQTSEDAA